MLQNLKDQIYCAFPDGYRSEVSCRDRLQLLAFNVRANVKLMMASGYHDHLIALQLQLERQEPQLC
jgi:hypothetical protein